MSTERTASTSEPRPNRRPVLRPLFLAVVLGLAAFIGLLFWPSSSQINPLDLSREDGRSRFCRTAYPKAQPPPNLTLAQRSTWEWRQYRRRHGNPNPTAYSFPPRPVELWSMEALLTQCMDVSGTRYLIAVECAAAAVEFGITNSLNGVQWVKAVERAIEASKPVLCYDNAKKRSFQDTLLLVREEPHLVKIVPSSKLPEYQKLGLVKAGPQ
jgi:hypothetical protein